MQKIDNYIGRKNHDPDLNMFLLGMDLTNFGLNLTDNEYNFSQASLKIHRKIYEFLKELNKHTFIYSCSANQFEDEFIK